jgi:hypothetical protein
MTMLAQMTLALLLSPGEGTLTLRPGPVATTPWGEIPRPVVIVEDTTASPAGAFGPSAALAPPVAPRPPIPEVLPFGVGEHLDFSIDYGFINAGGATMTVRGVRRVMGRECFDIRTEARSNAFFSKFYRVWDRAQTFLDVDSILPHRFEKHQREGGYRKDVVIKFDRDDSFARYENGEEVIMHPHAQDELSAFYYLRTLPLEVGRDLFIDNHTNRKNYPLKVVVHRREEIEVEAGKFDCFAIEPVIREGGIFTAKGTLTIWVTADERRMPVKMRTKIVVGSITASLRKYRPGRPHRPDPTVTLGRR